jgi:hypothetical protein
MEKRPMSIADFPSRGGVVTIAPLATGHGWAKDRTLLLVDYQRGIGWVATHPVGRHAGF